MHLFNHERFMIRVWLILQICESEDHSIITHQITASTKKGFWKSAKFLFESKDNMEVLSFENYLCTS